MMARASQLSRGALRRPDTHESQPYRDYWAGTYPLFSFQLPRRGYLESTI